MSGCDVCNRRIRHTTFIEEGGVDARIEVHSTDENKEIAICGPCCDNLGLSRDPDWEGHE